MGRILRRVTSRDPVVPGTLYWMGRKCGKSGCACVKGALHRTWVVTRSEQGRARLYTVKAEQRESLRRWTQAYRIYQRGRVQLVKQWQELLGQVDGLAEARRQPWPDAKTSERK